ncbi:MAG: bifunctional folylpolyglutamate synthase/dihydrofolate synthase [Planctomycetia bacterium]|nr:bifunctional folylpolyglutamate synthase/dihydrofolate synthase [Planctomycetia bacterium]
MRKRRSQRRAGAADRDRVLAWLDGRINYERVPAKGRQEAAFGLTRMRRLLARLGDPHLHYPVAHVAGTKGKGSTVAMLAAILEESGHRVGRYMSPHVHTLEERISIDGDSISRTDLVAAFEEVIPAVDALDDAARRRGREGLTWFEVVTAVAMLHFARSQVDVAVLETGLGGRLDATNVSHPLVTVITSISLDHMKLLGPTITKIAGEKAGIIKRGCPVISGVMQPTARRVIADTAARRRAPLLQLGRDFTVRYHPPATPAEALCGASFEIAPPHAAATERLTSSMPGRHQADNAALAVVAALQLDARGVHTPRQAVARGLSRARLPARIETAGQRPLVIVDAAHNVASMESLLETLRPVLAAHRRRALVFAASGDKQVEKMLGTATGLFEHVILTRYLRNPRAASLDRLRAACHQARLPRPEAAASPSEALALARSRVGPGGMIVVAGSFFLAAEVGIEGRDRA